MSFRMMTFKVFIFCSLLWLNLSEAKLVEKVLAIVNDSIITMTDVNNYRKNLRTGELIGEALDKKQVKHLLKDNKALLDKIIDKRIIEHEVKKKGYTVTWSQVDKEIRNVYKSHDMTKTQLEQALKAQGFSFEDYKAFMKSNMERQSLIAREVASKITIKDSDILNYYYSINKKSRSLTFQYTVSQLFWNHGKLSEAQSALAKLKNNEVSFDDLVKEVGSSSGKLGTFKQNDFSKEFSVVTKLEVGKFSDVIESLAGLHILRLDQKNLITNPEIEEKKEALKAQLYSQLLDNRLDTWLKEKRKSAFVRINK